ncbi:MAG: PQQ-binding-like beta-propeller repeat protein [bacterium]|nr:PQQ-binding-like beta-propeller repeat protein [bacterium]
MKKKLTFVSFIFISLFIFTALTVQPAATNPPYYKIKMPTAGVTVVKNARLRTAPEADAPIIRKLPFGLSFQITEVKESLTRIRVDDWYKIRLHQDGAVGWLFSQEGRAGNHENVVYEDNDLAGLYCSVALMMLADRKFDVAKDLFLILKEKHPNHILTITEEFQQPVKRRIKELVQWRLAIIHYLKKDYSGAIENYQKLLKSNQLQTKDIMSIRRHIMLIYRDDLKNNKKTLQLCYRMIRDFKDGWITGIEQDVQVDHEAAQTIISICSGPLGNRTPAHLVTACTNLLEISDVPEVVSEARTALFLASVYKKKLEEAQNKLIELLKIHSRESLKHEYDVSLKKVVHDAFLDAVNTIHRQFTNPKTVLGWIEAVKKRSEGTGAEDIKYLANYASARILDYGNGDRKTVENLYRNAKYSHVLDKQTGNYFNIRERLRQITAQDIEAAVVSESGAQWRPSLHAPDTSRREIAVNTPVTILYKEFTTSRENGQTGYQCKVKLSDGSIGWMLGYYLTPARFRPLFSKPAGAGLWRMARANPSHSNAVNAPPIRSPHLAAVLHNVYSNEVVFDDVNGDGFPDILACCNPDNLTVLDSVTGKLIWEFPYYSSTPVVRGDIVYLTAYYENYQLEFFALDKRTGKPAWQLNLGYGANAYPPSIPAITDSCIYVGTINNGFLCIDLATQKIKWTYPVGILLKGAITVVDGNVCFLSRKPMEEDPRNVCQLFVLNAADGKLKWSHNFNTPYNYLPGVCAGEELIFCTDGYGTLFAFQLQDGTLVWRKQLAKKKEYINTVKPTLQNDTVIFYVGEQNVLFGLDAATGKEKWTYRSLKPLDGMPAAVNCAVYVRSSDGYIHAVSTETGAGLWTLKLGNDSYRSGYSPTVAEGKIFICGPQKKLYVVGEKN